MDLSNIPIESAAYWLSGVATLAAGQFARARWNGRKPTLPCEDHSVRLAVLEAGTKNVIAGLERIEINVAAIATREMTALQRAAEIGNKP
jgi:hypothetical protein